MHITIVIVVLIDEERSDDGEQERAIGNKKASPITNSQVVYVASRARRGNRPFLLFRDYRDRSMLSFSRKRLCDGLMEGVTPL